MTKGCFHFSASFSATMRGIASAAPPGGKGTMMRTGFAGHSWALISPMAAKLMSSRARRRIGRVIIMSHARADLANRRSDPRSVLGLPGPGNLTSVAFRKGIAGKGGMPEGAHPESQAPKKFRVSTVGGLVFGTLSDDAPTLEEYIGPQILPRLKRVLIKPLRVLGSYTQVLPNNWKLYMDNVKDTYHASLLHLFFTRFRINRLTQKGGVFVSQSGAHHCTYTEMVEDKGDAYEAGGMRSAGGHHDFRLEAPELLEQVDELGDNVSIQILSLFPGFVLHQIRNSLAARQVVPKGIDRTE